MNFADIYTRQGLVREGNLPFVMGLECSGLVTNIGSHVTNVKVTRDPSPIAHVFQKSFLHLMWVDVYCFIR